MYKEKRERDRKIFTRGSSWFINNDADNMSINLDVTQ